MTTAPGLPLSEVTAKQLASTWSIAFTAMALGKDATPWGNMFAEGAKLTVVTGVVTITKGQPDPANGIVTVDMLQSKMAPEMVKYKYLQTAMESKGVQDGSFVAEVKRFNEDWHVYLTQYAVVDVNSDGLITFVRAFTALNTDGNTDSGSQTVTDSGVRE